MPTIAVLPKRKKESPKKETDMRLLRKKAYNSTIWRKVRASYLCQHPLCEVCLKKGKINAGTSDSPLQVHHLKSPFDNGEINWTLLGDTSNLQTICAQCHQLEHNRKEESPEDIIARLDNLLNDN